MKLTYEAILDDPKILERILADARRERASAMHEALVEPVKRLFTAHAARPHLARQG
jgi:hypothetical protein